MNNAPTVSVIMPAYNAESTLMRAVLSVIHQTFTDWQLLIMLPHMMEAAGVTEELKACDPMRWVGLMSTLTAQIEEILIRELICS